MEATYKNYLISDEKSKIDIQIVIDFLASSYWANKRTPEKIRESIQNSICYGVYCDDRMIGFARVITDGVTMYYICDVFILEEFRKQGISKKLIELITNAPEFEWMTGILGTKDAHGLYKQFAFQNEPNRFMIRIPQARQK